MQILPLFVNIFNPESGQKHKAFRAWFGNLKQRVPITSKFSKLKGVTQHYVVKLPKSAGAKGQLISECLFEKIVSTKIPTKNLIDSAQQRLLLQG